MLKVIALAAAIAVSASVASAQSSSTVAKSAAKTPSAKLTTTKTATPRRHATAKKTESQSALRKEAKIPEATARATALKEVPNGKVKSSELERENGKLIYSFAITVPGKSGIEEVNVDAIDGSVVSQEHESVRTEKKEAAAEKKEAAKDSKTKK
jgi:uncharacterized membrane protein YkoI